MRPDALALIRWADNIDCRARLPELVRRLVHSTGAALVEVDFAAGEGTQRSGVDGRVRAASATPFVPAGLSVWEMGCSQNPKDKADKDYTKRKTEAPAGVIPKDTTYVFVTPRRWGGKDDWVAEKRTEGHWADVRAYDADSLEQWLELSPPASAWLVQALGRASDVQTLEDFFAEWSHRTDPATPATLLLSGRDETQIACLSWLRGSSSELSVSVPDTGEAAAFVYAVISQAVPGGRKSSLDRAIVLRSDDSLRMVGREGRGLIVVALGCGLDVARLAARAGHHVLCANEGRVTGNRIELGPLDRPRVAAELERIGIDPETARKWSRECGGQTQAVRRLLGERPQDVPEELAPLLLVGSWQDGHPADLEIVERVVVRSGDALQAMLRKHSVGVGAPLRRSGAVWGWTSRLDAWRLLSPSLLPADLTRFRVAAVEVLTIEDPRFELEADERWLAEWKGKVLRHSGALRKGLAEAAAILGSEGDSREGKGVAADVVFSVLNVARSWQRWASLDDLLPTLAEAAPEVFLREVRTLVEHHGHIIRSLRGASAKSMMGMTDYLNGLVWALELLAWHRDYLPEACELLARISEEESRCGGDRAGRSLHEILLPWRPQTTAPIDERIGVLQSIVRRDSGVRFQLLLSLLPSGGFSTSTCKPSWRAWLADWNDAVTHGEVQKAHIAIWDLVIAHAGAHPSSWADVLPHLHQLSRDVHRPKALKLVGGLSGEELLPDERLLLWAALRKVLHEHRSFCEAEWALPESDLQILELLYKRIEPHDVVTRYAWLFSHDAKLLNVRGHDYFAEQEQLNQARAESIREIITHAGLDAVLHLAAIAEAVLVGYSLATGCDAVICRTAVHASTAITAEWTSPFRTGVAKKLASTLGVRLLEQLGADAMSPIHRTDLFLALPFETSTWDLVDASGEEAQSEYWRRAGVWMRNNVRGELSRAICALNVAGRMADAVALVHNQLRRFREETQIEVGDVVAVLKAALSFPVPAGGGRFPDAYHVCELLDFLQRAGSDWHSELAHLEWQWLPAMRDRRKPTQLHDALAKNPEFFINIISIVYRAQDEEPIEPDEQQRARIEFARQLLEHWDGMPGLSPDGSVDGVHLHRWVSEVRRLAMESRRGDIADLKIGEALARSPVGLDSNWPHEAVRDLLETLHDTGDVNRGFVLGRCNQRGVVTKAIGEGGAQERVIAVDYRTAAELLQRRWPVSARFLQDIANNFERYAAREDQRAAMDKEAMIWAASNEDRILAWVDALQATERFTFTLQEAARVLGRPDGEAKTPCGGLIERGRLASPQAGFYVIVPLEFRAVKCPPASWFIDDWMRWAETLYAVGQLTAAALHGAGHEQPQAFQVLVPQPREGITLGNVRVEFIVDEGLTTRAIDEMKTDTGTMQVLSAEETVFSLVEHVQTGGGIDAIATVVATLVAVLDPDRLARAAEHREVPVLEGLGELLSEVGGAAELATAVATVVRRRRPGPSGLRSVSQRPYANRSNRRTPPGNPE